MTIEIDDTPVDEFIRAASGGLGDVIFWKARFKDIQHTQHLLSRLEELESGPEQLRQVVQGLPYFSPLLAMTFPPLYQETDFNNLGGFWVDQSSPDAEAEDDGPGRSFARLVIDIEASEVEGVLVSFRELGARLEAHFKAHPEKPSAPGSARRTNPARKQSKRRQ